MAGTGGLTELAAAVLGKARPRIPHGPLVVALSGGADSAVCAWAAVAAGEQVRAITVDHGLPASSGLVAAAGAVAHELELSHDVVSVGVERSEDALRRVRYEAIEAVCDPNEQILTGHTADDQVETVLMNLARGAGARGLSGIPAIRGRWHRPLLDVGRTATRALAEGLELPFADDPGNTDRSLLRIRMRSEIVPALEDAVPGARAAIGRAGRLAAVDEAALDALARSIPVVRHGADVATPLGALRVSHPAVAARVARRMLRILLHPYSGTEADVSAITQVAAGDVRRLATASGLVASAEAGELVLYRAGDPDIPPPPEPLGSSGTLWNGWSVSADAIDVRPLAPVGRWTALVAPSAVAGACVRAARHGDRIDIGGGTKPVFEALREAGVPGRWRARWPVIEADGRMVWVPGARIAVWAAWVPGSGTAVRLRAVEAAT